MMYKRLTTRRYHRRALRGARHSPSLPLCSVSSARPVFAMQPSAISLFSMPAFRKHLSLAGPFVRPVQLQPRLSASGTNRAATQRNSSNWLPHRSAAATVKMLCPTSTSIFGQDSKILGDRSIASATHHNEANNPSISGAAAPTAPAAPTTTSPIGSGLPRTARHLTSYRMQSRLNCLHRASPVGFRCFNRFPAGL